MMKHGKNEAQTMGEMVEDMNEAKERGLSTRRGQSIYKKESGEYQALERVCYTLTIICTGG